MLPKANLSTVVKSVMQSSLDILMECISVEDINNSIKVMIIGYLST